MKVKALSPLLLLLFFMAATLSPLQAQTEEDEEEEYDREFVWGINKNTNGGYIGGLNVKFSNLISPGLFRTYGIELANVKHPKEARYPSFSGGTFIRGKTNYLYAIRFSMGLEKVLFKKGPQQGVQINALASAGPTIGLVSPYYVEYSDGGGGYSYSVPYDPDVVNVGSIYGPGRPFQGIGESSIAPGLHARTGVSFEFGTFKSNVSGLEIGLMAEAYLQRIQLMVTPEAKWFWPSAYITLFHGRRR